MEVIDPELWAIALGLRETLQSRERLQQDGVKMVAVFSESHSAIRRTAHLDLASGSRLEGQINRRGRAVFALGIAIDLGWVTGHSSMPGN
jgi:hypothetical protein